MTDIVKKPENGTYVYRSNDGDEVSHKFFEITDDAPFTITREEFKVISKIFKIDKKDNIIYLKRIGNK